MDIYNNVNLTNHDIDNFIDEIDTHIQNTIDKFIPKIQNQNSCEPYVNNKIRKIQKDKSYILSQITKQNETIHHINMTY